MTEFYVEKVLRVDLTIRGPYPVRDDLIVIEITGGSLSGIGAYADKLSGMVKAPSGDALVVDASGAFKRDVRLLAQMDDESFLHMEYGGRTRPNDAFNEKSEKGLEVGGDEVYFMIQPSFVSASPKYSWLSEHVFVGKMNTVVFPSSQTDGRVSYDIAKVS